MFEYRKFQEKYDKKKWYIIIVFGLSNKEDAGLSFRGNELFVTENLPKQIKFSDSSCCHSRMMLAGIQLCA